MKKSLLFILLAIVLVIAAACSGEDSQEEVQHTDVSSAKEEVEETSAAIEVKDALGETIVFDEVPASVAVLSAGDLDILHKLQANIIGRPTINGPVDPEVENMTEIGNPHQPNFEKIAEINPAVLIAPLSFQQYAENVEQQGTKIVYTKANSIEDIVNSIDMYGKIFGKEREAEEIIREIQDGIAAVEQAEPVNTLLVYGAPGSYLAALPNSLAGDLLEKAGGENIASDFPKEENYPQYASLSVEKIIERNPEMVMLITHGDPEAVKDAFEKEMSENAAWKNLDAVKNGNVIVLPSHLFGTNPGTKVSEALQVMQESLSVVK